MLHSAFQPDQKYCSRLFLCCVILGDRKKNEWQANYTDVHKLDWSIRPVAWPAIYRLNAILPVLSCSGGGGGGSSSSTVRTCNQRDAITRAIDQEEKRADVK